MRKVIYSVGVSLDGYIADVTETSNANRATALARFRAASAMACTLLRAIRLRWLRN